MEQDCSVSHIWMEYLVDIFSDLDTCIKLHQRESDAEAYLRMTWWLVDDSTLFSSVRNPAHAKVRLPNTHTLNVKFFCNLKYGWKIKVGVSLGAMATPKRLCDAPAVYKNRLVTVNWQILDISIVEVYLLSFTNVSWKQQQETSAKVLQSDFRRVARDPHRV